MFTSPSDSLPGLAIQLRRKKISAYRLAKWLGWKPDTINRYLKGQRFPSRLRLEQMAEQLECEVRDLFAFAEINPQNE